MQSILWHIISQANLLTKDEHCKLSACERSLSIEDLLSKTRLSEHDIALSVANYYQLEYQAIPQLERNHWTDNHQHLSQLPIQQWQCLAIEAPDRCRVYFADPTHFANTQFWQPHLKQKPQLIICKYSDLKSTLTIIRLQRAALQTEQQPDRFNAPEFIDNLLSDAIFQQASDIHIEPKATTCQIRLRIDGLLHNHTQYPADVHATIIARLKIMANLDCNKQRRPQDGRFQIAFEQQQWQCRINICQLLHGEKAVIRLMYAQQRIYSLSELGLDGRQQSLIQHIKQIKQGLILVTGPTGSGKTNTLYSLMAHVCNPSLNITTLENPVEIEFKQFNQCNINPDTGIDFSDQLRALLRQDPDIIMVGEIRDAETAMIAIKAAQTGHLVLSTLHTNDCVATILRLQHMGIPLPFLINSVEMIISQRLVRRLCQHCKATNSQTCPHCHDGFSGRCGVFELLKPSLPFQQMILDGEMHHHSLTEAAMRDGMTPLSKQALALVKNGITNQEEVQRVLANNC